MSTTDRTQSFGEQAARFSLYAPFIVLAIGILGRGNLEEPGVAIALFSVNMCLLVAGLVLGIVALASIRRFGAKKILGRASVGVLVNGFAVVSVITLLLPMLLVGRTRAQVAGHWTMTSAPNGASVNAVGVTFNKDGTFDMTGTPNGMPIAVSGKWLFDRQRRLAVVVEHVAQGDPSSVGKQMLLGTVRSVDDKQLVLETSKGDEVYARQP